MKSKINELILKIDQKKKLLDNKRPLSKSVAQKLKEHFDILWTYNTNAIEGSTLSLDETKVVLLHGITIGGKTLKEHLEVINHKSAIDFVDDLANTKKTKFSEKDILKIHRLVLKKIDDENAGKYRNVNVIVSGRERKFPYPERIPYEMKDFIYWLNRFSGHPVKHSALAHYKLVDIHPFIDGNGRAARLLMNLILMKNHFPPAIILMKKRKEYYDALKRADNGNYDELIFHIAKAVDESLKIYLEMV